MRLTPVTALIYPPAIRRANAIYDKPHAGLDLGQMACRRVTRLAPSRVYSCRKRALIDTKQVEDQRLVFAFARVQNRKLRGRSKLFIEIPACRSCFVYGNGYCSPEPLAYHPSPLSKGHSRSQPPLAIGRELRATCLTMPRKHSLIVVAHRVTEARRIVANQSSPSNGG